MKYRPWGAVDWALGLSARRMWHLIGAIGTEDRSIACWRHLQSARLVRRATLVEVQDVDSERYRSLNDALTNLRRAEFLAHGGDPSAITTIELMAEDFRVLELARSAAAAAGSSVVLDMSSFPKKFVFPLLRVLVRSEAIRDLLLTYTSPSSYAEGAPLYENIEPWRVLPSFGGAVKKPDLWIVSVGFLVESLRSYVTDNPAMTTQVLIPFPGPFNMLRRMWQSVASLEREHDPTRFAKFRVDSIDLSATFDRICTLAEAPRKTVAFAPFGPKPMSAAMCLYAVQRDSSVHYPQPTIYNPEYSKGIRGGNTSVAITAYWIKHDGEFLYALEDGVP